MLKSYKAIQTATLSKNNTNLSIINNTIYQIEESFAISFVPEFLTESGTTTNILTDYIVTTQSILNRYVNSIIGYKKFYINFIPELTNIIPAGVIINATLTDASNNIITTINHTTTSTITSNTTFTIELNRNYNNENLDIVITLPHTGTNYELNLTVTEATFVPTPTVTTLSII